MVYLQHLADAGIKTWATATCRFLNLATSVDLLFHAARSYSLMRPPRTAQRLILSLERSAVGWSGSGRVQPVAAVRASSSVLDVSELEEALARAAQRLGERAEGTAAHLAGCVDVELAVACRGQ